MKYATARHDVGIHLRSLDDGQLPAEVKVTHFEGTPITNGEWFTLEIAGVTFFLSRFQIAQIANDVQNAVHGSLDNALDPQEGEV